MNPTSSDLTVSVDMLVGNKCFSVGKAVGSKMTADVPANGETSVDLAAVATSSTELLCGPGEYTH